MGHASGALIGTGLGALGGPVGMLVGGIVGGAAGMTTELANSTSAFRNWEGDGGHHIEWMSAQEKGMRVKKIMIYKTDLFRNGVNTAVSVLRFTFAPLSTLAQDNKSFWTEHWFLIFDVIDSGYLVCYKGQDGIRLKKVSDWEEALNNCGQQPRNVNKVKQFERQSSSRSVEQIINRVRNANSYYRVNGQNCQDFANEIYQWF